MTTIGDVLAVIAALIGLGVTTWALMVSCALLFPNKVARARISSELNVRTNIAVGIFMLLPSLAGVAMLGGAAPLLKILSGLILLAVLSLVAIGATGLGYLAGDSMRKMDPGLREYPAFVRGSAFLVTASMLPILGWFVFAPLVILASLGGGLRAVASRIALPTPPVMIDSAV